MNEENLKAWEKIAGFWDEKIGQGNKFQEAVVFPVAKKMLQLSAADTVLEIGCSSGLFAGKVLSSCRRVVATDACEAFLAIARERYGNIPNLEFRRLDATNPDDFLTLGTNVFDKVACNMTVMDIPCLEGLFLGLRSILKKGGLFVFTIPHPCFRTNNARYTIERAMEGDKLQTTHSLRVDRYMTAMKWKQIGIIGQPELHYMFHRNITDILANAFRNGFVVNNLEEVIDPFEFNPRNAFALQNFREIPAIMAVSLMLQKAGER